VIRVGVGGWTFEPWRGVFYPAGLRQADELKHSSRHLTAIEINATFYGSQKPASFSKWHDETPDDFMFSLKGPRYAVNRRVLAEAGESIARFFTTGLDQLGDKLGPILWQLAATKQFQPDDITAFMALLPEKLGERRLRHALEVRHESFRDPAFLDTARRHNIAAVFADADKYPTPLDAADVPTADFVYARLQRCAEAVDTGYDGAALDAWAEVARGWADGGRRDVFVYFISGAKVRAPAAAMALIERLGA
jgi:uncharacterized protein YecE (DUF72 family)